MATQIVESLVDGGKASAGPPLGPALGPLGVNIGQIISDINKKTESFKGMQVPVKVEVDTDTKEYSISVGTPPSSSLIKKEAKVEKGAGNPLQDKVADLRIEQIIKIAKMKEDALLGKSLKEKIKEIIGTCNSMGILVHGVVATEAIKQVNQGKFDKEIKEEKTELSAEELKQLGKNLDYEITMEATHHGPYLEKPVMFVEIGSDLENWQNKEAGEIVAKTILDVLQDNNDDSKTVFAIGGTHYCMNFNRKVLDKNIAIGHVCPKHALEFLDKEMIKQAIEKTKDKVDFVLLDWKGLSPFKQKIVENLNELRIEYKRSDKL